jgi:hypothetical protein
LANKLKNTFPEIELCPPAAQLVRETWLKVNEAIPPFVHLDYGAVSSS